MTLRINGNVKSATLEAKIIRADGTVEDLGVIGYTSSNPIKRFFWNAAISLKRLLKSK